MFEVTTVGLVWAFLLAGAAPASAQTAIGPNDPAELEAFVDGVMAAEMEAQHIPGAVVVVVKDGEVLFAKGYGYADLEARTPVDPDTTLFRPGSVSKLFVWTAVMQLVEQGKLSLDADVNTYLDFTIPATFPEPITLKHLLTHTPGFEDRGDGLFKLTAEDVAPLAEYLKTNLPARVFTSGTIGAYSNYGTALAGYIVERVAGQPFTDYVETHLLAPLGMTQATFRQPLPANLAADMSRGYNYANGGYVRGDFEYVVAYPAGSLSASGAELAKFMIAHLQNGRYGEAQILREETTRQMHSRLYTPDPRLNGGMAYGFFEEVINGQRIISHGGDTFLFHSGLFLLPEQNTGLFISTNGTAGAKLVEAVMRAFMDRYFPMEAQPAPSITADFSARVEQYTGDYYLSRSNFTGIEKFIGLTTPINVSVDGENHVSVSLAGEVKQYIEVEPGLLQNRDHPESRIVLRQENGQVYLHTATPFVLIKSPPERSPGLNLLILIGGALLFAGTLISWAIAFIRGLLKREARPLPARLARLTASLFGLSFLAFLILFGVVFTDMNPAYGVPNIFFGVAPGWFGIAMSLPILIALLGLAMLVFAGLAWWRRYWTVGGRIFYTGLTVVALAIVWALYYWNLLL
jgi:CubicO group peptidase (beta-lactamase class C family)